MLRAPFGKNVSQERGIGSVGLSRRTRLLAAIAGTGLIGLLLLASRLSPDPRGFGTHEQFGFPGCTIYTIFGKRCPACGMTTAWAHLTQAHVVDALAASVGGTLLAVAAMIAGPSALAIAARGRMIGPWPQGIVIGVCVAGVTLGIAEWGVRLWLE